jgi:hypothetical protein
MPDLSRHHAAAARLALLLPLLAACGGGGGREQAWPRSDVAREVVAPVVERDATFAPRAELPASFDGLLEGARVVLLGEHHWMLDHHCAQARLLPRLGAAGVRTYAMEESEAYSWMAEDYVGGVGDDLPEALSYPALLLRAMRAYNAGKPEAERIRPVFFDVNYEGTYLADSLRRFQARFGRVAALDPVLAAAPDGAAYRAALSAAAAQLAAQEGALRATLGAVRYTQLVELVAWELRSLPWRTAADDASREAALRDGLVAELARAGAAPVVVTTGGFHAQKRSSPANPGRNEPYGAWLQQHPESYGGDAAALRSVAFGPGWGQVRDLTGNSYGFDVRRAEPGDVARILSELAGDRTALLPLADPVFQEQAVAFGAEGFAGAYAIGQVYDAVVLYPDTTVLPAGVTPSDCP